MNSGNNMPPEILVERFFESRKNANCLLDLQKCLLSEEEDCILSSIDVVRDLFTRIFERNMLHHSSASGDNEKKYKIWLLTRYEDFVADLLKYLSHTDNEIKKKSLEVLMKFVILEGKMPLTEVNAEEWYFPKLLFQKIVAELLSDIFDQQYLIETFKSYSEFDDVQFYTLKSLINILNEKEEVNDIFLSNCFHLLTLCSPGSEDLSTLLSQEGARKPFAVKKKLFSKIFSNAWRSFLKYELPLLLLKKVLIVLPKKVMPYFQNPYLLTDFLTDLYNKGGLVSLLSLSGLFVLMQKYNVEYPDFYSKLYSLFEDKIVNSKFNSKFFYLSNIFLSSTHLPGYLVAAFVKRLSRISLYSNTECILKILPLIYNLLIRHPTLNVLIHRTDPKELSEDPFNFNAVDPAESDALESSLWEIKTLQNHINPDISRKAKVINNELPKLEFDISSVLDFSIAHVYHKERKRKFTEAPTAVQKPTKMKNWWILTNKVII